MVSAARGGTGSWSPRPSPGSNPRPAAGGALGERGFDDDNSFDSDSTAALLG